MADQDRATIEEMQAKGIVFHYIKSNFFRVLHIDGVWGGLTPAGSIQMSVFNESPPIPHQVVYCVNEDGTLGEEKREARVGEIGIVREFEAELILSKATAIAIRDWLTRMIDAAGKLQETPARPDA